MTDGERALTTLRAVTAALLTMACLVTLLVVGRGLLPVEASELAPLLTLALWLLLPYAALAAAARWLATSRVQGVLVLVGAAAATVVGLGVLVDAFVLHPAFLNFLVLLALPWLQWAVVAATLAVTAVVRWAARGAR